MSAFSNYMETMIVEASLRGGTFTEPSNTYVALFTADPTDANTTANEVQAGAWPAYARQDAAAGGALSTGWTASSNGATSNAKEITFPANNGAASVTVTHLGVYDALTGGNLLYHTSLVSPKTLLVDDVVAFAIGAIDITVA